MKQMLFETRQKAQQLLESSLAVWRQSDMADALEDIEKDPVFSLLMMALAYQSNETDSEIERLKAEVQEDFARMLVPYDKGHAMPATAVVETVLQDDVADLVVNENSVFRLSSDIPFIPLLETRALNARIQGVKRLDGRRWKVSMGFKFPVKDLSLFCFALKGFEFRDLNVTVAGRPLPLIKPWQYSELPLTPCFSLESMTYNYGQMAQLSLLPMDLFARQNVRLFCVEKHSPQLLLPMETDRLDFIFEFTGIGEEALLDENSIALNPVMLVNAQIHETTLTSAHPIARLVGPGEKEISDRQFLHLVRPPEFQLFGKMELAVRGVAGDRFNQGSLVRLLNCITTKYHSDFYAYQQLKGNITDSAVYQLESALDRLNEESLLNQLENVNGVYLMPLGKYPKKDFSLGVRYLTTAGAAVNAQLSPTSSFSAPSGFNASETRSIAAPVPGTDEIREQEALGGMLRYYLATGDRIVTLADIKLFCLMELQVRYGLESEAISQLRVHRRLQQENNGCGYDILVAIGIKGTAFVKRSFAEKVPMAEILMEKMIEVRSTFIYPVHVQITIEEE